MHLYIFSKCKFSLLSAEQQVVKTSLDISVFKNAMAAFVSFAY